MVKGCQKITCNLSLYSLSTVCWRLTFPCNDPFFTWKITLACFTVEALAVYVLSMFQVLRSMQLQLCGGYGTPVTMG